MRWKLGVALLVVGALSAVPLVVKAVTSVGASITAKSHRTPFEITEDLDAGRYVVFERTGTTRTVGPITSTNNDAPTLSPELVDVVGPDGAPLPTEFLSGASETITQGNAVYTGVLEFEVATPGSHQIVVRGEGRQVLVSRSLGDSFRGLLPFVGVAAIGGVLFLGGLALLIVGAVRSGRKATPAPSPTPSPGWYADPGGGERLRYWDGAAWTEHTSP